MADAANRSLVNAKTAKLDEFYTQLSDVERELKHYREHFNAKTVYCNCDDPWVSSFFKYFSCNFEPLGLIRIGVGRSHPLERRHQRAHGF